MKKNRTITNQGDSSTTEAQATSQQQAAPGAPEGTRVSRRRRTPSKRSPSVGTDTSVTSTLGATAYGGLGGFIAQCNRQGMNKQSILHEVGQYVDRFNATI